MRRRHVRLLSIAVLLPLVLALVGSIPVSTAATANLTNGCNHTARGIPSCGAYVGGTYGANSDVTPWESSMGKTLGVHRTFWGSGSVSSAVKTAKADAAKGRVPWMSFNPPYSWTDMAAGKGDAWAKDLATKMKAAGGPVWVAVAHEPENDGGDMQKWKAMQARIAPIMRAAAPNLGYSIILMGYHQLYGQAKYSLANTWPNTTIDVAGFDIYEKYGVKKSGKPTVTTWKDFKGDYFSKINAWAKSKGVRWGLAETGYSDPAAKKDSTWMSRTYNDMKTYGGIAFSYFNTDLHSQANWQLGLSTKKSSFTGINKGAPTLTAGVGASDSVKPVLVAGTPSRISFVGQDSSNVNSTAFTVQVPKTVRSGDALMLFASQGSATTLTSPGAGWTQVGRVNDDQATTVWRKVATSSDAGSTVRLASGSRYVKVALTLAAYRGVDTSNPIAGISGAPEAGSSTSHTTPWVANSTDGALRVSYWSDENSATTRWTTPAGEARRVSSFGTGGGRISALLTDSGEALTSGSPAKTGGRVSTTDAESSKATAWTVLLRPAG